MGQFWIKLWAGYSTLTNQDIEGDIIINSISSLTINLVGSSIKEKINEVNTAVKFAINLDSDSKIIFTVNSYYTSIVNEKTDGTNLINGTYKWTYTEGKEVKSSMVNFQVVNLLI
jgi:hypothetical protein